MSGLPPLFGVSVISYRLAAYPTEGS